MYSGFLVDVAVFGSAMLRLMGPNAAPLHNNRELQIWQSEHKHEMWGAVIDLLKPDKHAFYCPTSCRLICDGGGESLHVADAEVFAMVRARFTACPYSNL